MSSHVARAYVRGRTAAQERTFCRSPSAAAFAARRTFGRRSERPEHHVAGATQASSSSGGASSARSGVLVAALVAAGLLVGVAIVDLAAVLRLGGHRLAGRSKLVLP
jgi:hypothetical protein